MRDEQGGGFVVDIEISALNTCLVSKKNLDDTVKKVIQALNDLRVNK